MTWNDICQLIQYPVIEGTMILEFQRAQRVRDSFQRIGDAMGVVIHWINTPFVTRPMMADMANPVNHGIAQVDIGGSHIDSGAQNVSAVRKLASLHAAKEVKIFLDGAVTIGTVLTCLRKRASQRADFLGSKAVHVGFTLLDEMFGKLVELVKVVRRIVQVLAPFEAEPSYRLHY